MKEKKRKKIKNIKMKQEEKKELYDK